MTFGLSRWVWNATVGIASWIPFPLKTIARLCMVAFITLPLLALAIPADLILAVVRGL